MTTTLHPPASATTPLPPPHPSDAAATRSFPPPLDHGAEPSSEPPPSWRGRAGFALRLLLAAAGIFGAYQIDGGIFGAVVALFVLTVPFEKLYPRQRGQRLRRPMLGTDVTFALMGPILNVIGITVIVLIGLLSLFWVPGLLARPLIAMLPGWGVAAVAFVTFDFIAYWAHRWAHEVPFLWRFHAVHHSPEHMDWISGFRIHPFDGIVLGPGALFLLAAGVDAELTGLLAVLQVVLGIFFHANVRVRWRWLDKLVANPEFHHWHHANEADAIGHNYAPALPQWDLLFGTYFMPDRSSDRRPRHYGVDGFPPRHMMGLLTYPVRGAGRHLRLLWHPIRAVRAIAGGVRVLLRDVRRSTFRKTHSVRRVTAPGCTSTNGPLFEAVAVAPGVPAPAEHEVLGRRRAAH